MMLSFKDVNDVFIFPFWKGCFCQDTPPMVMV